MSPWLSLSWQGQNTILFKVTHVTYGCSEQEAEQQCGGDAVFALPSAGFTGFSGGLVGTLACWLDSESAKHRNAGAGRMGGEAGKRTAQADTGQAHVDTLLSLPPGVLAGGWRLGHRQRPWAVPMLWL